MLKAVQSARQTLCEAIAGFFKAAMGRTRLKSTQFELQHSSGLQISRQLTEEPFVLQEPTLATSKVSMHNGWVWYQLPAFLDGTVLVGIALGFKSGVLDMISISNAHPSFGTGWHDWSDEKERQRAASIGSWLAAKGYSTGAYPWGSVWVGFDSKGGVGSAIVYLTVVS